VYVDVMIIFPHGTGDVQARLMPYPYQDEAKGENPIQGLDGIGNLSFPASDLVQNDFWSDINAGNAHDKIISMLEEQTPDWAGKITKTLPQ
jgi:hypothetical protein